MKQTNIVTKTFSLYQNKRSDDILFGVWSFQDSNYIRNKNIFEV